MGGMTGEVLRVCEKQVWGTGCRGHCRKTVETFETDHQFYYANWSTRGW
jgi:hypothetical protein